MGLGGSRKQTKLPYDPNNTAWSRSTTKYGQRILQSQGWTPGDSLGVKDTPHAGHQITASASHIRVALKDDHLGLGAKHGADQEDGKTTGLDMFQDLLGRLNGKSEGELVKEQESRSYLKRSEFVEQRWGRLRFVDGGLLVGDELQKLPKKQSNADLPNDLAPKASEGAAIEVTKRHQKGSPDVSKRKNLKRSKCWRKQDFEDESSKASSKFVSLAPSNSLSDTAAPPTVNLPSNEDRVKQELIKVTRRAKKVEHKLEWRHGSEARKPSRDREYRLSMTLQSLGPLEMKPPEKGGGNEATQFVSKSNLPVKASSYGCGRHAVRRRYIQHKKMSMMDGKALNEILMIKV